MREAALLDGSAGRRGAAGGQRRGVTLMCAHNSSIFHVTKAKQLLDDGVPHRL